MRLPSATIAVYHPQCLVALAATRSRGRESRRSVHTCGVYVYVRCRRDLIDTGGIAGPPFYFTAIPFSPPHPETHVESQESSAGERIRYIVGVCTPLLTILSTWVFSSLPLQIITHFIFNTQDGRKYGSKDPTLESNLEVLSQNCPCAQNLT